MEDERDTTTDLQAYHISSTAKLSLANNERYMNNTILNYNMNCDRTQIYNSYPNTDTETYLQKNECIEKDICYYNSKTYQKDGVPDKSGEWINQFYIDNRQHNNMVPAIFNQNTKKHFINKPIKKEHYINPNRGDIYGKLTKY